MPAVRSQPADIAAALAWWREAGVDHAYHDKAEPWLKAKEAPQDIERGGPIPPPAAPPPESPRMGGDPAAWPRDLAGFIPWWLSEPTLDHGMVRGRVPPRGEPHAPLMVLVAEPEAGDEATGQLLSGANGRLLQGFLAAAGLAGSPVWLASALVRHTLLADWGALAESGLGEVVTHHIALARPRQVLVFGRNIPPLLGHDPAQRTADLRLVNQEAPSVSALFAPDLGHLVQRPGAKAAFWRTWLDWTAPSANGLQ
jgi:DNA polymerase